MQRVTTEEEVSDTLLEADSLMPPGSSSARLSAGVDAIAASTHHVIQVLRRKLIDRDRDIFSLRKHVSDLEEALHRAKMDRLLLGSSRNESRSQSVAADATVDAVDPSAASRLQVAASRGSARAATSTTNHVAARLLQRGRSAVMEDALERRVEILQEALVELHAVLRGFVFHATTIRAGGGGGSSAGMVEVPTVPTRAADATLALERSGVWVRLQSLEAANRRLHDEVSRLERHSHALTAEGQKLRNDAEEEKLRSDILQHRVEQMQRAAQHALQVEREAASLRENNRNMTEELTALRLQNTQLTQKSTATQELWTRRYAELLASRDALLQELNQTRVELMCSASAVKTTHQQSPSRLQTAASFSESFIETGPIRLTRAAKHPAPNNRNPYASGMFSPQ